MPPSSRGFGFNTLHHAFRLSTFRPRQPQRLLSAKRPTRPSLPAESEVKASIRKKLETEQASKTLKNESIASEANSESHTVERVDTRSFSHLRRWVWCLFFLAPPIAVAIMFFPVTVMRVQGESMTPLLNSNISPEKPAPSPDRVIVLKVRIPATISNLFGLQDLKLERGQVVVYYAPHNPNSFAIKRVVALPGDTVRPLPGYPGGDKNPVIVGYNHLWVEGDANSRAKSVDSNHFGPISQNLVYGFVLAVYKPWTNWPVRLAWEDDDYPAKHSGRIEQDVVQRATLHPDAQHKKAKATGKFNRTAAADDLAILRRDRYLLPTRLRDKDTLLYLQYLYSVAKSELESPPNPDTANKEIAQDLIDELEIAFEVVGLSKDGTPLSRAERAQSTFNLEQSTNPARREGLREYLEKHPVGGSR